MIRFSGESPHHDLALLYIGGSSNCESCKFDDIKFYNMDDDQDSGRLVFLEEEVKAKLSVLLQAEFDLDTHKEDARKNEFIEKVATAKKEWLDAKENLTKFQNDNNIPASPASSQK